MFRYIMLVAACGLIALGASTTLAESYQKGDRVVVIERAEISLGKEKRDDVWPGLVLTVSYVKDNWIWVSNGHPGWLNVSHVIPLDRRAITRLTDMIERNPRDASLYFGRAIIWGALGELDIAIADTNEAIRLDPKYAAAYNGRGIAWKAKGEYDKAIDDYNEAIRLDPKSALAYNNRGRAWDAKGEYDKAIDDYNEALRLDPKLAVTYNNRGIVWKAKGEYDKAIDDYNEALRLDPKYALAYNSLAWLKATCPDSRYQDGKQAVTHATKACELTGWKNRGCLDTLAGAYAESGDFDEAVRWQTKAVDLAPADEKADYRSRLELYREHKPYREEKKP